MSKVEGALNAVRYLRQPSTIRLRCAMVMNLARQAKLKHFRLHWGRLDKAVDYVEEVIRGAYPSLDVPYHSRWRHFGVGHRDRVALLRARLEDVDSDDVIRSMYELAIISVLLDAGAGPDWRYQDQISHASYTRSEGLAVASFNLFWSGFFSDDPVFPFRVDAGRLAKITLAELAEGMQVTPDNPLVGMEGRVALLNRLGRTVEKQKKFFPRGSRLGEIYDAVQPQIGGGSLDVGVLFAAVLGAFSEIWPGRIELEGENLGDVWHHYAVDSSDARDGLVPFHKLSQWLTYSLVEPLEWNGCKVTGLEQLTGLPEYRNGGLFIDLGVLELIDAEALKVAHQPSSELIVEWRALTVGLLDELARRLREKLQLTAEDFPLAKVLQGGTWTAGRKIAAELRQGEPPLQIDSDGTVF